MMRRSQKLRGHILLNSYLIEKNIRSSEKNSAKASSIGENAKHAKTKADKRDFYRVARSTITKASANLENGERYALLNSFIIPNLTKNISANQAAQKNSEINREIFKRAIRILGRLREPHI